MADLDEFVALHRDPEVVRFVRALDRSQAEERLQANEQEWGERGHGLLAVLDRSSGRLLGRVGLKYWPQFRETEAGWLLRRDAWGHGYATEAGWACLRWGFAALSVSYITAMIQPENTRSIRVARRLGFEPVREDMLLGDPVIVHAVKREDWTNLNPTPGHPPCLCESSCPRDVGCVCPRSQMSRSCTRSWRPAAIISRIGRLGRSGRLSGTPRPSSGARTHSWRTTTAFKRRSSVTAVSPGRAGVLWGIGSEEELRTAEADALAHTPQDCNTPLLRQ